MHVNNIGNCCNIVQIEKRNIIIRLVKNKNKNGDLKPRFVKSDTMFSVDEGLYLYIFIGHFSVH